MKKIIAVCVAAIAAVAMAATTFPVGIHDAGAPYGVCVCGAVCVSTNATQTATVKVVVDFGAKSVTNTLYSLTCTNGYAASSETKLIPPNAKVLVENAPVTLFGRL